MAVTGVEPWVAAWAASRIGVGEHAPVEAAAVAAHAAGLRVRPLAAGQVLFTAGQAPTGVWIVRTGAVELTVGSGRHRAVVDLPHSGDLAGDLPLLLGRPPACTARAARRGMSLLLDPATFTTLLAEHPQLARRWLGGLARRLYDTQRRWPAQVILPRRRSGSGSA